MLNHPNIIRYYNSFHNDQTFHIIMEYATHGTLENFVNKCPSTSSFINQEVFFELLVLKLNLYYNALK